MFYTLELELDLPRERVIALFDDPDNLLAWQTDLVSFEPLEGEPWSEGATAKLHYRMGKGEVEMIETVRSKDLPEEMIFTYEAKGVWNQVANYFDIIDANRTRWRFECEFRFQGFMKLLAFCMPWMFKGESRKYMQKFKAFAEQAG